MSSILYIWYCKLDYMTKINWLFPYKTRFLGIVLILIHIPIKLLWDAYYHGEYETHELPDAKNILFSAPHLFFIGTTLVVLIGLFLVAFSREKIEDEQIVQLRLDSLRWAIYLNYAILLFTLVFTRGTKPNIFSCSISGCRSCFLSCDFSGSFTGLTVPLNQTNPNEKQYPGGTGDQKYHAGGAGGKSGRIQADHQLHRKQ